jgi:hypothetical protein
MREYARMITSMSELGLTLAPVYLDPVDQRLTI